MSNIHNQDISTMAGQTFSCPCGRSHVISIRHIQTGSGAVNSLYEMVKPFCGQAVYLTGDENTLPLGRDSAAAQLHAAGCTVAEHAFSCPSGTHLVTDKKLIGSMLLHMPKDTGLIVAIGSGTMNDTARVLSAKCGIPYIIIGTAPSMDGYASVTSAVVMDEEKKSVPLTAPYGIIADTDLMKTAPDHMLAAGAGDMLGKYTALRDWELAHRETGEDWCPEIAALVSLAANRVADRLPKLYDRNAQTVKELADALILSGLAILMHGTSRPAAGLEHQIAHYWEVEAIRHNFFGGLHGHYVGLASLIACRMYEMAEDEFDLPGRDMYPSYLEMQEQMELLKTHINIQALNIKPEDILNSILHTGKPEIRYTLASFLSQKGRLHDYAQQLTKEFA